MKALAQPLLKNSTTVRILELRQQLLSASLRVESLLIPGIAARTLNDLFMRTTRFPVPEPEREILKSAHPFRIPFRNSYIQAWSWGDGPTVLLVHGWSGRGAQFYALIPALLKAGYSVVTFDAPSHGASPGGRSNLLQLSSAIYKVALECNGVTAIIAHSLGAAATAHAFKKGLRADRAVFIAPPSDPRFFYDRFCQALGVPDYINTLAARLLEKKLGFHWSEIPLPSFVNRLQQPLLIFHDEGDSDVPVSHGQEIAACWPGARLITTQGLGHRRILRSPVLVEQTLRFLTENDDRS